jgi:ankyrin repeat protein
MLLKSKQWVAAGLFLAASLSSAATAWGYYTCTQPDGSRVFTDTPGPNCDEKGNSVSPGGSVSQKPKKPINQGGPATREAAAEATHKLFQLGVPYSENEFLDRVRQGDPEIVRLFLAAGMDPDAREYSDVGRPAILWASTFGHTEVVAALLEYGGAVDAASNTGATGLMAASIQGFTELASLLIEKGADVKAATSDGKTPLMFAAAGGGPNANEMIDLLLQHNASIDEANADGGTALIVAAANGYSSVVQNLVSHGADLNLKDKDGRTALMWAVNHKDQTSITTLKNAGAK